MTLAELIAYLRYLMIAPKRKVHPTIERISGLVPSDVDAMWEYHEYVVEKYR